MKPASIIISSYNYGRFLEDCIDSALSQTYPDTEVIVIDDGSSDNSREIIEKFGSRVIPLFKKNGGQASVFNLGIQMSKGQVICLLDSDDMLLPTAVERAVKAFDDQVVHVQWRLWEVDEQGNKTGRLRPKKGIPARGNLFDKILRCGPDSYVWSPTSGNAWARRFLERVIPIPEEEFWTFCDSYLANLAPVFGSTESILEPQSLYRLHEGSTGKRVQMSETMRVSEQVCLSLYNQLNRMGIASNPDAWALNIWQRQMRSALREFEAAVPSGETLILVDQDNWGSRGNVLGRQVIPFPELEGRYAGPPPNDASAIEEVKRLRKKGASYIVFAPQGLWWLDHYPGLHSYLRTMFHCVLQKDCLVVFDIRDNRNP